MNDEGEWRPDPSGEHRYRYFDHGRPTAWVNDGGRVYQAAVPPHLGSVRASRSGQDPSHERSAVEPTDPTTTARVDPVVRAAGWYCNVADPNQLKYWDGSRWSEP